MLAVTDTGTGMTPEVIEQGVRAVLHHQGRRARAPAWACRMVYGFVKQSGGHVKIYSEPGQGTTVKIYLPRYVRAVETRAAARDAATKPQRGTGETILVVEDDEAVRAFVSRGTARTRLRGDGSRRRHGRRCA